MKVKEIIHHLIHHLISYCTHCSCQKIRFRVLRIYNFDLRESQGESSDTACNKSCIACYSKLCTIVLVQCYYLYTILLEQYVVHTYLSMWKKAKVHCQYSQLKAVCAVESVQSLNLNWSINPKVHIVFSQVLAFLSLCKLA